MYNEEINITKKPRQLNKSPTGVFLMVSPQDGIIHYTNSATYQLFNLEQEKIIGLNILDLFPQWQNHKQDIANFCFSLGTGDTYELRFEKNSGEIINLELVAQIISCDEKEMLVCFCRDISYRKSIEEQLFQAQKMEALGTMAGGLAHDFNHILTRLLNNINRIKKNVVWNSPILEEVQQMEVELFRGIEINHRLLSLAKRQDFIPIKININDVIRDVLMLLNHSLPKNIDLQSQLGSNLWSIEGDFGQLHQVFLNLCLNALDAMPEGGKLTIKTYNQFFSNQELPAGLNQRSGKYLVVEVRDTGQGIDQKILPHIFDPFFTTKAQDKGTGLGLAVAYAIIQNHRGVINVESEEGEGSCFRLFFPALSEDPKTEVQKPAEPLTTVTSSTILLIDDEPEFTKSLSTFLQNFDYKVIIASNGSEVQQKLANSKEQIDLAIIDLVMPEVGGEDTALWLKDRYPHLKIIFISGYEEPDLPRELLNTPLTFLHKPIEPEALLSWLDTLVKGSNHYL